MKGRGANRRSLSNKQSFGILTHGSAITAIQEATILLIRGMITAVLGVISVSSRNLRRPKIGEVGEGFAIRVVTMGTKASTSTRIKR